MIKSALTGRETSAFVVRRYIAVRCPPLRYHNIADARKRLQLEKHSFCSDWDWSWRLLDCSSWTVKLSQTAWTHACLINLHGRAPLRQYIFGPQRQMFPGLFELTLSFHNIYFFKGYSVVYQVFDQSVANSFFMKKTIIIKFNNLINYCDTISLCDAYRFVALEIIYRMRYSVGKSGS